LGGPTDNRFTAYDTLCAAAICREAGVPQVSVNLSNLTLFVRVTDLAFGGGFSLDRSYNQDDTRMSGFGPGWSFTLGDTLTTDTDGSLVIRRGTGRIDRFTTASGAASLFAVTGTTDTLTLNSDGTYTLRSLSGVVRVFSSDGRLLSMGGMTLDYSSAGQLTAAHYRGRTITFSTDAGGHFTSIADGAGRTASFSYSSDGHLTAQTNADGSTVAYTYNDAGNLASVTYGGGTTAITYAGAAPYISVASVTTPDAATRQYDTPDDPSEIRMIDGNGDPTWYVSTETGWLASVTDSAGNTLAYSYDASGNRIRVVNAAGETSSFTYDSSNRLTSVTDGGNNRWTADYSAAPTVRITDPNKKVWVLKYDASNNLLSTTDPLGNILTALRNGAGQITALTDGLGNKSSFTYTSDGLLNSFTDALGNQWSYAYDGAARPATRTDPSGGTLQAQYTARNRISALSAGNNSITFDYSGVQRDSLGRITQYTDSFGNQIQYTYDAAGQLTGMTLPGGKTVSYQYDHQHHLSKVSDWNGNFALYRYDAAGWPISLSATGPAAVYQYDGSRHLRAIVSTGPDGTPVAGYNYTLDPAGNRLSVSALEPNTSPFTLAAYTIGYDGDNRPVTRGDGQNYNYDARGNLSAIQGSRSLNFSYDPFGRLSGLGGDTTASYAYDSAGLRSNFNDRRQVWDLSGAHPRLVAEVDGGNNPIAWYVYGLGLLWKVGADGTAYFYHFDGDGNVVAVSNPSSGVISQYRYDPLGRLVSANEGVSNGFRAHGETATVDDQDGLLFTGDGFQFPDLRLTLPATADPSPPAPDLTPRFSGAAACFTQGVAACSFATGRRDR
jgi:YD repeat-containing protein